MKKQINEKTKQILLFSFAGMLIVVGIFLLTSNFFNQDISLWQKLLISLKLALAIFLPIISIGIFFSSFIKLFLKSKTSKKVSITIVSVGTIILAFIIFIFIDRIQWKNSVEGIINTKYIPALKEERICKNNTFVEYAPKGKYIIFRCGDVFYPLYKEYNITTKEFIDIIQNITLEAITASKIPTR